jgi:hypothetical protein
MWREARARGGSTAVAMRVEGNEIGGMMSELATFGTAVTGEPVQLPPRRGSGRRGIAVGQRGREDLSGRVHLRGRGDPAMSQRFSAG